MKMSKSHTDPRSRILLSDSDATIRMKIKHALTDSQDGISYDVAKRPGVSNLLNILYHVQGSGVEPPQLTADIGNLSMQDFKKYVADEVISVIGEIRTRYFDILVRTTWLEDILADGAQRARENASNVLKNVYNAVGLR